MRIACPICGSRPDTEFWFGGEVPDLGEEEFERAP
jgi:sarcosine oxidase delta subunit